MATSTSILLAYTSNNKGNYQLFKEFLKFIGVYVGEKILTNEKEEVINTDYSAVYMLSDELREKTAIEKLQILKKGLIEAKLDDYAFFDCFDALANVFVDNNLALAATNIEFFLRAKTIEELWNYTCFGDARTCLGDARTCFDDATSSINNIIKSCSENPYLLYARLYCKYQCDRLCVALHEGVYYYVNELIAEGLFAITNVFPEFSNAWVLLCHIQILSHNFYRDAIDSLHRSIKIESTKKEYMESTYYLLSKLAFEYHFLHNEAIDIIRTTYKLSPNYLNCYRLARQLFCERSFKEATPFFNEALNDLHNRHPLNPNEQVHYFSTLEHLGILYLEEKNYYASISHFNDALTFRESLKSTITASDFYFQFYNDSAIIQKLQKLVFDDLNPRIIFYNLSQAYSELNMPEDSKEYWQLYKQC